MAFTISYNHIIPNDLWDSASDTIFLFFFHPDKTINLLNQITYHIQGMDKNRLQIIEKTLNMHIRPSSWDSQGNICFSDYPDLRPEFRTTFQPIDLWDYYYALWHSMEYWNNEFDKGDDMPLPNPDLFWEIVQLGARLRDIHSRKSAPKNHSTGISSTPNKMVQLVNGRFKLANPNEKEGCLYLNEDLYLSKVSKLDWEYQLSDIQPLHKWCQRHVDKNLSPLDFEELLRLIDSISKTRKLQKTIDDYFSKTVPPKN